MSIAADLSRLMAAGVIGWNAEASRSYGIMSAVVSLRDTVASVFSRGGTRSTMPHIDDAFPGHAALANRPSGRQRRAMAFIRGIRDAS